MKINESRGQDTRKDIPSAGLPLCPFCGGEADYAEGNVLGIEAWVVRCTSCFASTRRILMGHPIMRYDGLDETTRYTREEAKAEARKAWERRAGGSLLAP